MGFPVILLVTSAYKTQQLINSSNNSMPGGSMCLPVCVSMSSALTHWGY